MGHFITKMTEFIELQGLAENFEFNSMIIYFLAAAVVITLIFSVLTSKVRIIKYLPGLILTIVSLVFFYKEVMQMLDRTHIMSVYKWGLFAATGLMSLLTALAVGIFNKKVRPRRRKKAKENNTPAVVEQE